MTEQSSNSQGIHALFEQFGANLKLEKDRSVFLEGQIAEDVYLIKTGTVRISKDTESGKILTLRISGNSTFIGEASIFCDTIYHSVSANTIEPTELLVLSRATLEKYLSECSSLMMEWIQIMQTHNLKNETRFRDLLLHGKKGALMSTLIRLTNTYGVKQTDGSILINHAMTNQELANFCATSREVVNRILNDLKKKNVLSLDKGMITIHDLHFLRTEVECDNCPLYICRID
ncbi:Crp/Fnr family transcriptional regulator [Psychrobacillus sp. NPDC096623]|uniref:Crp/Fnr family transcriptional regulator n=1 Tax=Psychrobacillus sp. NPDC096623 TaxID=3364492 RepID=UPI0037F6110C